VYEQHGLLAGQRLGWIEPHLHVQVLGVLGGQVRSEPRGKAEYGVAIEHRAHVREMLQVLADDEQVEELLVYRSP
jgi:hypothetical protein